MKAVSGPRHYIRGFDLYRVVACIGVVGQHSVLWPVTAGSVVGWGLVMVLHTTREAFFFLAAFVACVSQLRAPRRATSLWLRRFGMVLGPYVVWTALSFGYTELVGRTTASSAWGLLRHDLWVGYYQLYFLVVLFQLYLLLPVLVWLVRLTRGHHRVVLAVSLALQLTMMAVSHYASWRTGVPGWFRHIDLQAITSRRLSGYQLYVVGGLVTADHLDELEAFAARSARRVATVSGVIGIATIGAYLIEVALGQNPGHASDLYQPIAVVWFVAAICGLAAWGYLWAQASACREPTRLDRLITWGADVSGGVYLAHVLVLEAFYQWFVRYGLGWGAVSALLFVCTLSVTALAVGFVVALPVPWLRRLVTGPDRRAERRMLGFGSEPSVFVHDPFPTVVPAGP